MEWTKTLDFVVVGAGISGIVTLKCLREAGLNGLLFESTDDVGGLWNYRKDFYGVMECTHINVSRYNYAFSDYPFPEREKDGEMVPDFPRHDQMLRYIKSYCTNFGLDVWMRFQYKVDRVYQSTEDNSLYWNDWGNLSNFYVLTAEQVRQTYRTRAVAVCTGHHAKPKQVRFAGQNDFRGQLLHSVDYKSARLLRTDSSANTDRSAVVVGIGNSAVDVAADLVSSAVCKKVYLSTRSGAWVLPNYVFGYPTDLYACRVFLWLPWRLATIVLESIIRLLQGSPFKWRLNPCMRALQTQPTVSPTLLHHIQRGHVQVVPNVAQFQPDGHSVKFSDGSLASNVDVAVLCTGYTIDLPFLDTAILRCLFDGPAEDNQLNLYKSVFLPEIGCSLAFVGFVQPASGGVLPMAEMQARWLASLLTGKAELPSTSEMRGDVLRVRSRMQKRYYGSSRHTIQYDPLLYCDDVAAKIGCRPSLLKNWALWWRLLLGSAGAAQYRLNGPGRWSGAGKAVADVPVTSLMNGFGVGFVVVVIVIVLVLCHYVKFLF